MKAVLLTQWIDASSGTSSITTYLIFERASWTTRYECSDVRACSLSLTHARVHTYLHTRAHIPTYAHTHTFVRAHVEHTNSHTFPHLSSPSFFLSLTLVSHFLSLPRSPSFFFSSHLSISPFISHSSSRILIMRLLQSLHPFLFQLLRLLSRFLR